MSQNFTEYFLLDDFPRIVLITFVITYKEIMQLRTNFTTQVYSINKLVVKIRR